MLCNQVFAAVGGRHCVEESPFGSWPLNVSLGFACQNAFVVSFLPLSYLGREKISGREALWSSCLQAADQLIQKPAQFLWVLRLLWKRPTRYRNVSIFCVEPQDLRLAILLQYCPRRQLWGCPPNTGSIPSGIACAMRSPSGNVLGHGIQLPLRRS